jgi:hypothetical protein
MAVYRISTQLPSVQRLSSKLSASTFLGNFKFLGFDVVVLFITHLPELEDALHVSPATAEER